MNQHQDIPEILKLRIYDVVREVPPGMVSTYGDIATVVGGGCDARTVGYALNAIPKNQEAEVPWQRIINAQGGISTKGIMQRHLLEQEGIVFGANNRIDLRQFRWPGPSSEWAAEHGFQTLPTPEPPAGEQLSLL